MATSSSSYGATNRSVFELQESGATNVLLDSVQFHIDGVFSKTSSVVRCDSVKKLIQLCTSSRTVLAGFRSNGVAHALLRIVGLLATETDVQMRVALQSLGMILCRHDDGSIMDGFEIPLNVFAALSSSIVPFVSPQTSTPPVRPPSSSISSSSSQLDSAVVPVTGAGGAIIGGGIHRKRKFAAKGSTDTTVGLAVTTTVSTAVQLCSSSSSTGLDTTNARQHSNATSTLYTLLWQQWPTLLILLGITEGTEVDQSVNAGSSHRGNLVSSSLSSLNDVSDEQYRRLGCQLALTVISRFMTSLVQRDTQTEGEGNCPNPSSVDDFNEEDTGAGKMTSNSGSGEMTVKKGRKTSKMSEASLTSLAGYQALLRYEGEEEKPSIGASSSGIGGGVGMREGYHDDSERYRQRKCCLLEQFVQEVARDISAVIETLDSSPVSSGNGKSSSSGSSSSGRTSSQPLTHRLGITRSNHIYQILCLLEASCFRCPDNQHLISSITVNITTPLSSKSPLSSSQSNIKSKTSNGRYSGSTTGSPPLHSSSPPPSQQSDHRTIVSFPRLLLQFLSALFPHVADSICGPRVAAHHNQQTTTTTNNRNTGVSPSRTRNVLEGTVAKGSPAAAPSSSSATSTSPFTSKNITTTTQLHSSSQKSPLRDRLLLGGQGLEGSPSKEQGLHGSPSKGQGLEGSSNRPWEDFQRLRNLFPELPVVSIHTVAAGVSNAAAEGDGGSSGGAFHSHIDGIYHSSSKNAQEKRSFEAGNSPYGTTTSSSSASSSSSSSTCIPTPTNNNILSIGVTELWLCCLKLLVNLTHDGPTAAALLMADTETKELCSAALAVCVSWRDADVIHPNHQSYSEKTRRDKAVGKDGGGAGALSPTETLEERFLFDSALFLLTLLSNLAETNDQYASTIAEVDVSAALQKYSLAQYLCPTSSVTTQHQQQQRLGSSSSPSPFGLSSGAGASPCLDATMTMSGQSRYCFSPSLAHIRRAANAAYDASSSSAARQGPGQGLGQGLGQGSRAVHSPGIKGGGGGDRNLSSNTAPSLLSMTQLVLSILCRETATFLGDLETAEEQLLLKQQPQQQEGDKQQGKDKLTLERGDGRDLSSDTDDRVANVASSSSSSSSSSSTDKLPVAELILSSHASLLLYTFCATRGGGVETTRIDTRTDGVGANSDLLAVTNRRRVAVRACLPHRSWWLPIRALKAFLVLQGQTGVMLLESISPVVLAITGMEEQDEIVPLSFPEAAARARKNKTLLEEQRRNHHQSSPLAMPRTIKGRESVATMGTGGMKVSAALLLSQQGTSSSSSPSRSRTMHTQLMSSSSSSLQSHSHPPPPPHHHHHHHHPSSSASSSSTHHASSSAIRPSPVVLAVDTTKRNKLANNYKGRDYSPSFSSSYSSSSSSPSPGSS